MELYKKNLQPKAQFEDTYYPTERQVSKFNTQLVTDGFLDSIDIFLEDNMGAYNSPGDKQILGALSKFKPILQSAYNFQYLSKQLDVLAQYVRMTNSEVLGPKVLSIIQGIQEIIAKEEVTAQTKAMLIKAVFLSEGQLSPRLEMDPYQSFPIGNDVGDVNFENSIPDDRSMDKPMNGPVSSSDIEKFDHIYETLNTLVGVLNSTSHPSTKLFENLGANLNKALLSAWRLKFQLKSTSRD